MGSETYDKDVLNEAVAIIRRLVNVPHYSIFLFGSRAAGTANPRSDYDIGIESKDSITATAMSDIRDALDLLPILQKMDVVDVSHMSADVRELALKTRKVLYEQ